MVLVEEQQLPQLLLVLLSHLLDLVKLRLEALDNLLLDKQEVLVNKHQLHLVKQILVQPLPLVNQLLHQDLVLQAQGLVRLLELQRSVKQVDSVPHQRLDNLQRLDLVKLQPQHLLVNLLLVPLPLASQLLGQLRLDRLQRLAKRVHRCLAKQVLQLLHSVNRVQQQLRLVRQLLLTHLDKQQLLIPSDKLPLPQHLDNLRQQRPLALAHHLARLLQQLLLGNQAQLLLPLVKQPPVLDSPLLQHLDKLLLQMPSASPQVQLLPLGNQLPQLPLLEDSEIQRQLQMQEGLEIRHFKL